MEYQREPVPGFHPVSLSQLQAADREVHVRMGSSLVLGSRFGRMARFRLMAHSLRFWLGCISVDAYASTEGSSSLGGQGADTSPEKPLKPPKKPRKPNRRSDGQ